MATYTPAQLLEDFSVEMTGKDVPGLREAAPLIPAGTRINVTFLGNEDLSMRLIASKAVLDSGFIPVPHISARRLKSQEMLEEFLGALKAQNTASHVFSVGGDPHEPEGPYEDSLEVIQTGLLQKYGASDISIAGYPEGHPDISDDKLWAALTGKHAALTAAGTRGTILTQFGFDEKPVLTWIEKVRAAGIDYEIRIGVPGPAGIKRLLSFAARFGVASSAGIAKKYGLSLTNLMGTAGPDKFINRLAKKLDPAKHGVVKLHFYTFGGLAATSEWIRDFKEKL
ncbi:MAG: methylenetetrahydrofolate reductase [Pseudolysinimonas sp.]|uniref:methylenetetrahydrofolate reductase n=1 Tax=Pseudolysinimonas sp. TaxID=2680009 RepID=UPI0032661CE1